MKSPKPVSTPLIKSQRLQRLPEILVGVLVLLLALSFQPPRFNSSFGFGDFGRLPVLNGGRIKPLDTVARISVLIISGKQTVRTDGGSRSAIEWLADVLFNPAQAAAYPIFDIDNPDVLGTMGMTQTSRRRYSFAELEPHLQEIEKQAGQAAQVKPERRSRFQTAMLGLGENISLYERLQSTLRPTDADHLLPFLQGVDAQLKTAVAAHVKVPSGAGDPMAPLSKELEPFRFISTVAEFFPLPVGRSFSDRLTWWSMGQGIVNRLQSDSQWPGVSAYAAMGDAYRDGDAITFDQAVRTLNQWLTTLVPDATRMSRYEYVFNYYEPFYKALLLYLLVFLLVCASWLYEPRLFIRAALYVLALTFTLHTVGLISRMILQARPPVTNLYSSAIFVGWVAVLLGLVLEYFYRNGIGSMVASIIGFLTLIIAHHLAASGDTLEMMRAVLDSNFWLATHVVCVTIGYSSTFLSGFLATLYIFRRLFDPRWNEATAVTFERMVYGVVCFATLFSFVGTILGGIWADQSWGRFWGWDPKENGALMIVLWNVFILHARWGGHAKQRNLMAMAVFGNIVTALSWFGVNMLGIGLHSYGFMDKAFVWLILFVLTQIAVIVLGLLPDHRVRSIPFVHPSRR